MSPPLLLPDPHPDDRARSTATRLGVMPPHGISKDSCAAELVLMPSLPPPPPPARELTADRSGDPEVTPAREPSTAEGLSDEAKMADPDDAAEMLCAAMALGHNSIALPSSNDDSGLPMDDWTLSRPARGTLDVQKALSPNMFVGSLLLLLLQLVVGLTFRWPSNVPVCPPPTSTATVPACRLPLAVVLRDDGGGGDGRLPAYSNRVFSSSTWLLLSSNPEESMEEQCSLRCSCLLSVSSMLSDRLREERCHRMYGVL